MKKLKLTLYSTLILPHLTYCCSIWGNTYKSRLSELIKLQKKALRIVYNKPLYAPTNSLFQKARCLKLEDLIKLNTNVIMYKAFNNLLPQICSVFFLMLKMYIIIVLSKNIICIKHQFVQMLKI